MLITLFNIQTGSIRCLDETLEREGKTTENYLFDQFIGHLIVCGCSFFFHLFTHFHWKMAQSFATAIGIPSASHKALYWLAMIENKNGKSNWKFVHLLASTTLTFLFWCCASYLKYLSLYYLIRIHFQFVQCVRFDSDCQALMPSTKQNQK